MTQPDESAEAPNPKRRRRGPSKPFPTTKFEDALVFAKTIVDEGVSDQMRRLTLFDRLGRSPDSGPSRQLVTASSRYGLTTGGYQAEHLTVTDAGRRIAARLPTLSGARREAFDSAIGCSETFSQLYERLKNQRLPGEDVLRDELRSLGVQPTDHDVASEVFIANARYLGLVREVSGSERIIPFEQLLEEDDGSPADAGTPGAPEDGIEPDTVLQESPNPSPVRGPSVHIDIQVHIDSTANAEQIDQIFASMAKHLYGRDV